MALLFFSSSLLLYLSGFVILFFIAQAYNIHIILSSPNFCSGTESIFKCIQCLPFDLLNMTSLFLN